MVKELTPSAKVDSKYGEGRNRAEGVMPNKGQSFAKGREHRGGRRAGPGESLVTGMKVGPDRRK